MLSPKSFTTPLFAFHTAAIPAQTQVRNVRSPRLSLVFVCAGGYSEGQDRIERTPGNIHTHPAGDAQSADTFQSGVALLGVCFDEGLEIESGGLRRRLREPLELGSLRFTPHFLRILHEIAEPDPCPHALEGLGMEALAALDPAPMFEGKSPPRWLRSVYDQIESEPLGDCALSSIAKRVSVDRAHLAREYRRFFGMTIGEHARNARLGIAAGLLTQASLPLEDAAIRAGFYDASHLKRCLRKATGWQAAALRKAMLATAVPGEALGAGEQ